MADGDALSKMIQLQASKHDIRLAWTGHGVTDLSSIMHAHAVKARMAKHLWTALSELHQMAHELPEQMQAKVAATILQASVLTELETEAKREKPKPVPVPA